MYIQSSFQNEDQDQAQVFSLTFNVNVNVNVNVKHNVNGKLQVMLGTVTFASMNVHGMGDIRKRRDVLNLLKAKQYNIYSLQDTHLTNNDIPFTRSIWGFE